ncbi:translocation protein TolB [compost metagenome]
MTRFVGFTLLGLALLATPMAGCQSPLSAEAYPGLEPLPFLPEMAYQVVPSPDGTQIAYSEKAGLFVVDLATGTPRKLAESEGPISAVGWVGDGRAVTFLPTTLPPITEPGEPIRPPAPAYQYGRLQRVDLATGAVTATALAIQNAYKVVPSPDGRYLAVTSDDGLHVYDAEGDVDTVIATAVWQPVIWSPDSRRLVHITFQADQTSEVVITTIPDKQVTRLAGLGIHMSRMGPEYSCSPEEDKLAWTRDGARLQLVQNRTARSFGLTTFTLDGQQVEDRTLSVADPVNPRRYVDCYRPSPDGRFVVALQMSGESMIPEPSSGLIGIETDTGTVRAVAPPSGFVGWLGRTSRFVIANQTSGRTRYFVADAARGR